MRNGHLLNERYKIKEKIGGGGMADVFLARDIILDRDVAVKALRMEYANDAEFIARFDREAQSATSLSHPNIVSIYDVGEEDDLLYMVMEYVDGMTLKEYIQRYGPLGVEEALDIMKQITSAIAHAHANDIVHRDIKPQNILINHFGQAKVTDFGIAIALSATALTQTNSILGSVHYLSPEQARGGMATKKSDIYSLGIVLFEMLTGRLPFSGQSPVSIALKHLQSDTPSVRRFNQEIPQSVENIVLKATAKNPFHRYETIYDLEEAVETALRPDKLNEEAYTPPVEVGEETKAIPIITDDQIENNYDEETLIHHTNGTTLKVKDKPNKKGTNKKIKGNKKKNKPKKEKKPKKKRKWLIVLTVLFLLLGLGVAAILMIQPKEVTIPDVVGEEADVAKDMLEDLKLVVEEQSVSSEEVEEGNVVRTNPRTGRTVKVDSVVTLFVSEGKEKVTFDDYVGRDINQVKRLLENQGYEVTVHEKHSDRPKGEIITQIDPDPNSKVIPEETEVTFEVSIGPDLVSLNNLTGMSEDEARSYLEDNNLKINVIEENSDSVDEGNVIRHSPQSGTELEENDTVDVYVSIGPEEKPPRSHTITYTVPYKLEEPEGNDGEPDNPEQEETEEQEMPEQIVRIYIGDMNHDISVPYREETITEDTAFTFTLTIEPGSSAEYKITRDDENIVNETVRYEEGG